MIRFACPVCRTAYQVPDDKAGHKRTCPSCGQRMQVPAPPPSSTTVLAPLLEYQPDPVPRPEPSAPMAIPVLAVAAVAPEVESPAPIIRLPTRRRRRVWPRVIAGVLLLTGLAVGLRLLLTGGHLRDAGQVAENRSHTRTDAEELVKRAILGEFKDEDAAKVEFLTWGPHMSKREWLDLLDEAGLPEMAKLSQRQAEEVRQLEAIDILIRVRYKAPSHDWIEEVAEKKGSDPDSKQREAGGKGKPGRATGERGSPPEEAVLPTRSRLVFSMKTRDEVYLVAGKFVRGFREGSDDWKQRMRKRMAKQFPGIKP